MTGKLRGGCFYGVVIIMTFPDLVRLFFVILAEYIECLIQVSKA